MPVGPFRRLISRGPGVRGDIVREGHINQIYDALETMPAFADLQSPVSIVGTGPLASRPVSASEGEAYIAVDGGVSTIYIWSDGAWVDGGTLQGPEGPKGDTGAQGARGEKGDTGDTGPAGDPGEGVPVGGTTGQVLAKASGADLDAEWVDPSGDGTQAGETTGTAVAGIVLDLPEYDSAKIHHSRLTRDQVAATTRRLLAATHDERAAIPVMHPGRVDVIGAGSLVLLTIMEHVGADEVVVSEHDILDGIAWSTLER